MNDMKIIKTCELQIGDTVCAELNDDPMPSRPWSTTFVVQIKDGQVHLWRPYGHTADFSYTGGVVPYIGVEQYQVAFNSETMWLLFRRKELR